ncbi:hypothetical protein FRC01_014645 [Tulasnella sp. 417]|nr:hypothetical protein FRC01_014645 [Tulasnella sp. 417]
MPPKSAQPQSTQATPKVNKPGESKAAKSKAAKSKSSPLSPTDTPPDPPPEPSTSAGTAEPASSSAPTKGRAKGGRAKKTTSLAREPEPGPSKSRKGKGVSRGRAPTLAGAILRARMLDPRLQQEPDGEPIAAEMQDHPHILPWVPHLLDALDLPRKGMFDDNFTDSRGRKPTEEDRLQFTIFWDQVKQQPDICSHQAMKHILGSAVWLRWANASWAPRLSALVRAELVRTGDSWTQRQLKIEANYQVDMSPATVAAEKKSDILSLLFGDAAFNQDRHAKPIAGMDVIVKDIVYRVCDQEGKRYRALKPTMDRARETLKEAIKMMEHRDDLDIAKFKDAVSKANQLRSIFAGVSIEPEGQDEKLLDDFTTASLDVITKKEAQLRADLTWIQVAGGTTDRMVWSKAQIDAAKDIYAACFLSSNELIDISNDETLTDAVLGATDLGVDLVRTHDKPVLYRRLGIPSSGHIPHLKPFEAIRPTLPNDGPDPPWDFEALRAWADKELEEHDKTTPAKLLPPVPKQRDLLEEEVMERDCPRTHRLIRCHLHQVQGVMALAEQAFKESEGKVHVSSLLADSMGLGKTLTAIVYALMVAHWFELQRPESAREMPPYLANRFWCGSKQLPDGPIVIVVPNNLLSQWVSELRSFVVPALIDILVFDPRGRDAADKWWAEVWEKSRIDPHRRIIITTSNALKREADRLLSPRSPNYQSGKYRADPKPGTNIFSITPNVLIIDEIHVYRNLNRDAHGVLTLSLNARHTIGLTGTPVYNATLDLLAQACVLGIPGFVGDDYVEKKAQVMQKLPKRRDKASLPQSGDDIRGHIIAAQTRLVNENKEAIALLKGWFAPHIIRRTMASEDPFGNPILPPIHNTVSKSYVKLSEEEEAKTRAMSEDIKDTENGATQRVFNSQNFYTEYRLCLQWPGHRRVNQVNRSTIRSSKDWDLDDFDRHGPSKMLRVVEILDYHIPERLRRPQEPTSDVEVADRVRTALNWKFPSGEKVSPPSNEEVARAWNAQQAALTATHTQAMATPPPDIPIVGGLRRIKIIITLTYTMYLPILVKLLQLRGYAVRTFTGDTPINERAKVIEEFNTDNAHPADGGGYSFILIMSGIGITGLNCTRGCIMIHFDQAWSQQEENQATHRIVRLGQIEHCIIYKVLALGTTDIWMNQIASGKELMLDLFSGTDSIALRALKDPGLLEIGLDDDTQPIDIDAAQTFDPSTVLPLPSEEPVDPNYVEPDLQPSITYAEKGKQKEGAPPIYPSGRYPPDEVDNAMADLRDSLEKTVTNPDDPEPNFDEYLEDEPEEQQPEEQRRPSSPSAMSIDHEVATARPSPPSESTLSKGKRGAPSSPDPTTQPKTKKKTSASHGKYPSQYVEASKSKALRPSEDHEIYRERKDEALGSVFVQRSVAFP